MQAFAPGFRSPSWSRTATVIGVIVTLVALTLASAVWLSVQFERSESQDRVNRQASRAAVAIHARLTETEQALKQAAPRLASSPVEFQRVTRELMEANPALLHIELRMPDGAMIWSAKAPPPRATLTLQQRTKLGYESWIAFDAASRFGRATYASPYYVQIPDTSGFQVLELAVPVTVPDRQLLVAVHSVPKLLEHFPPPDVSGDNVLSLTEPDGTSIARQSTAAGARGGPTATASIELPGTTMLLRAESLLGEPKLVPNLLTGMLALVSIALGIAGFLLWTDVTRRTRAERALREEHAFRKAMEDSLVTGLLARDLHGRITYVNPAFCEMTGYASSELIGRGSPMPYVAPEVQEESDQRHAMMVAGAVNRQGYETVFMRKDGSRLPVLIHEAPLIDATGRHTGWMSSVLDLSDQKRIEELNRRQQEKLQSHSRLSMLGEVASALSHELNQPLAAITSYATACENLLASPPATLDRLRGALARIRSQTDRAAQVIQSVQDFVRSRALERQSIEVEQLVRGIEPLIQLQAKRIGARFTWRIEPGTRIDGDRILLEQVVLNLTRNGIESMASIEPQQRWLEIRASRIAGDERGARVEISICDRGVGVPPEVVPRLFTPFFTTKNDGMGLGLNLCRSVIEQHSGHLGYRPRPGGGSIFYFALPCR